MRRIRSLSGQTIVFLIISVSMYVLATLFALAGAHHLKKMLKAEIYREARERVRITRQYMDEFVEIVPELARGLERRIASLRVSGLDKLSESLFASLALQAVCLRNEDGAIVESLIQRSDGSWDRESEEDFAEALKEVPGMKEWKAAGKTHTPTGLIQIGGEWWLGSMAPIYTPKFRGDVCFFGRVLQHGFKRNVYSVYGISSISAIREKSWRPLGEKIGNGVWLHFDSRFSNIQVEYKDFLGQGGYFLEIPLPMTLYREGLAHLRTIFAALYGTVTLSILFLYYLLRRVLLAPLARLTQDVAAQADGTEELEDRASCAELEILTERINEMLRSRARHNQALEELAYSDTLTDLKNRHYFMKTLAEKLKQPLAPGRSLALFLLDINNFKQVNETLGYDTGDCVLQGVAKMLTDNLTDMEHLTRLSADEFAMMCECEDEGEAYEKAMRIMHLFLAPIVVAGHPVYLTVTLGNCLYPRDGSDRSTLLRALDMALQKAKQQKGNAYQSFDRSIAEEMVEESVLETDLRLAVETEALELWYQPKLSLKDSTVTGCEALLRWNRGGRYVPPGKVIPIARSNGLIIPLSLWIVEEAARAVKVFEENGFPISVSFNAPIEVILFEDFLPTLRGAIEGLGLLEGRLVMEITEDALVPDFDKVESILSSVRNMGCRVSVDDFGTGYSSLSYLYRLQIDELKVDRIFVMRLPEEKVIVETIVAMSRALGLDVVAEGVESHEQLRYLSSIGCDSIQGFVIGRPEPLERCLDTIRKINGAVRGSEKREDGGIA